MGEFWTASRRDKEVDREGLRGESSRRDSIRGSMKPPGLVEYREVVEWKRNGSELVSGREEGARAGHDKASIKKLQRSKRRLNPSNAPLIDPWPESLESEPCSPSCLHSPYSKFPFFWPLLRCVLVVYSGCRSLLV
jgi:hypothetical protein